MRRRSLVVLLNSLAPFIAGSFTAAAQQTTFRSSMSLTYPSPIIFKPKSGVHKSTLIFLHGLGDSGAGWADVAEFDIAKRMRNTKIVLPTAPQRPITLNMGMRMNGWFDLTSLDKINADEDEMGLRESMKYVDSLIEAEVESGIPSDHIMVGGFSQGGAMALLALRSQYRLAGIVALSGYLPLRQYPPLVASANAETPALMCHGDSDPTVKFRFGQMSAEMLKEAGAKLEFKAYVGLHHGVNTAEITDMVNFIASVLS